MRTCMSAMSTVYLSLLYLSIYLHKSIFRSPVGVRATAVISCTYMRSLDAAHLHVGDVDRAQSACRGHQLHRLRKQKDDSR